VAGALFALARALRRRRPQERLSLPMPPIADANVERVGDVRSGKTRVQIVPVDRSTAATLADGEVEWIEPALGRRSAEDAVEIAGRSMFRVRVFASGYAPRDFAGEAPRGGAYALRVPLRTWREELFDRARQWMRHIGAAGIPAAPTPREALRSRQSRPDADVAFVEWIERGTYGPENPDASVIRHADELLDRTGTVPRRER
jgi:hypothetical protein